MAKSKAVHTAIVQFDVKLGNTAHNVRRAVTSLCRLAHRGVKLAVLPEMWASGFDNKNMARHAKDTPAVLKDLAREAQQHGMWITGTLPEAADKGIYNTAFVMDHKGEVVGRYRKIHLFRPTGEEKFYKAGHEAVVVDSPWGKIGLLTCYDLRFPELARDLALLGARILIVSAQWPLARVHHWQILAQARAVENQVFVLAANRSGRDPGLEYGGGSIMVSPAGEVMKKAGPRGALLDAALDMGEVDRVRKAIPVFKDRRPEIYIPHQKD